MGRKICWREYGCCCLVAKLCLTVCDPQGQEPTRFLCPWDFPGKNTGVSCQFLLQGIFSTQGLNPGFLQVSCTDRRILYWWATEERVTEGKKWGSIFTCHPCSGQGLILSFKGRFFFSFQLVIFFSLWLNSLFNWIQFNLDQSNQCSCSISQCAGETALKKMAQIGSFVNFLGVNIPIRTSFQLPTWFTESKAVKNCPLLAGLSEFGTTLRIRTYVHIYMSILRTRIILKKKILAYVLGLPLWLSR